MNILFSVQAYVREEHGRYYDNNVTAFVSRYKKHCDKLTCMCTVVEEESNNHLEIESDGVDIIDVMNVNTLKRLLFEQGKNKSVIEQAVRECDACIVHMPSRIGETTIKYAKKYKKPYLVVVVSCVWDSYWNYNLKGKFIAPSSFFSTRAALKDASHVIYVTDHFLQSRYSTKGISVGCSNVKLPKHSEEVLVRRLERLKTQHQDNLPLKLATLAAVDVPYKGQAYVIRAIARLKKLGHIYEYHIAGMGDPAHLVNLAESLGVREQLIVHGVISHDKISDLLDEIDIYIQPSKQEGLPRAMIEAMSRACPALGSRIAGIPELLEDRYLFDKGNVGQICNRLLHFTVDQRTEQAKRNFDFSKKYAQEILNEKRDNFISQFIKTVKSKR